LHLLVGACSSRVGGRCLCFGQETPMATLKIEPSGDGKLWVAFTRFNDAELARLKQIPGARWHAQRKQWSLPESPETRRAVADMVASPPGPPAQTIAVRPKSPHPEAALRTGGGKRYIPGKDKPLTTNPPHPFIEQVDDELVLRGMAYLTRKA
jgi:hypothetical protein